MTHLPVPLVHLSTCPSFYLSVLLCAHLPPITDSILHLSCRRHCTLVLTVVSLMTAGCIRFAPPGPLWPFTLLRAPQGCCIGPCLSFWLPFGFVQRRTFAGGWWVGGERGGVRCVSLLRPVRLPQVGRVPLLKFTAPAWRLLRVAALSRFQQPLVPALRALGGNGLSLFIFLGATQCLATGPRLHIRFGKSFLLSHFPQITQLECAVSTYTQYSAGSRTSNCLL